LHLEHLETRNVPTGLGMLYQNGVLIPHMEVQGVYLGSAWKTSTGAANVAYLDKFLSYLVNSPYTEGLTRAGYPVGTGTASPGVLDPLEIGTVISDSQIETDLQKLITAGRVQAPDPNRIYVIYVGQGTEVTTSFGNSKYGFLGYHLWFSGTNAAGKKTELVYAVIPYKTGGPYMQGTTLVTSHELAEAATDPTGNGFMTYGGEISDRAHGAAMTLNNGHGDSYLVALYVGTNGATLTLNGWTALPGTTTTLGASELTIASSTSDTFTITVAPGSPLHVISGTIELMSDNKIIGLAKLHIVNGVAKATITTALNAGTHVLDAVFAGDKDDLGGFSDPITVQVT
jgi:hypothetical protein